MDEENREIVQILDEIFEQESVRKMIDSIVLRVEEKLMRDSESILAWEPVPLDVYGEKLPNMIRSSWVFVIRARTNTGPERHPNSYQRMLSYRGSGDLQIWDGKRWCSNPLISESEAPIESRWITIPQNVWHQAVVLDENWVVVSFHTVPADELIEERPHPTNTELTRQRKYLDEQK